MSSIQLTVKVAAEAMMVNKRIMVNLTAVTMVMVKVMVMVLVMVMVTVGLRMTSQQGSVSSCYH